MTSSKTSAASPKKLLKFSKSLGGGFFLIIFLLAGFAKLSSELLEQELAAFDTVVGEFVRSFATPGLTKTAIVITNLGSAYVEICLTLVIGAILFFRLKYTWETVFLVVSLSGAWLLNIALKAFFQRARPDIVHLVQAGGYSYPSGHAMVSVAFYGMLGYLLWSILRNRSQPAWPIPALTSLLILAIGISRIYLGVHFASDVLAGYTVGGVWAIACIIALRKILSGKEKALNRL